MGGVGYGEGKIFYVGVMGKRGGFRKALERQGGLRPPLSRGDFGELQIQEGAAVGKIGRAHV